jgi:hypothetical protein
MTIRNSNTTDSGLKNVVVTQSALDPLLPLLGSLAGMATLVDAAMVQTVGKNFIMPRITTMSAATVNPTDFFAGDSTLDPLTVASDHLVAMAHASHNDRALGLNPAIYWPGLFSGLAAKIWALTSAKVTTGNFSTVAVAGEDAAFDVGDVGAIFEALPSGNRALYLNSKSFGNVADNLKWTGARWVLPGFPGGVYEVSTAACGSGIWGWSATPRAMALVFGQPQGLPKADVQTQAIPLPDLGVSITACTTFQQPTRTVWVSAEVVLGSAIGTGTELVLLKSP